MYNELLVIDLINVILWQEGREPCLMFADRTDNRNWTQASVEPVIKSFS